MLTPSTHAKGQRALVALVLIACNALASCIVIHPREPKPPSPLQTATAVHVAFDYSGLMVAGMGAPKTEAEWVAAKTADDPEYPKTWADLKTKWEDHFLVGLSGGSPLPVTRAPASIAFADPAHAAAPALLADATGATAGAELTLPGDVAPQTEASDAAPTPAATTANVPPDGTATVKVSMTSLQLGKYIPMYVTKAEIHVTNTWWMGGRMVDENQANAEYRPTMSSPSVFQHTQIIGRNVGEQTAKFLRRKHQS